MIIEIPEDIKKQLEAFAEQQNVEVIAVLQALMDHYRSQMRWATLAEMARNAKEANLSSPEPVDTSARSREILNTEFADYLKRRMDT